MTNGDRRLAGLLLLTGGMAQGYSLFWAYSRFSPRRLLIDDMALFQHAGWYLTKGARLYVDIWEPKPPLPYETTALLALLAGEDMLVLHWLNVAATGAAAVGTAALCGHLIRELGGDHRAAVLGGLSPFVLPAFHLTAVHGFKAKYFLAAFGLAGVYLQYRSRPIASGAAAAAGAGYYQFGIVFPALCLGVAARADRRRLGLTAGGILGLGGIAFAPVVHWGAVPAFLAEAVVVPLVIGSVGGQPLPAVVQKTVDMFGIGAPLLLVGVAGATYRARPLAERWWVLAGTGWALLQVLAFDFEGAADLFLLLPFVGIGIGLHLTATSGRGRRLVELAVVAALVASVAAGGIGFGGETGHAAFDPNPRGVSEYPFPPITRAYWESLRPDGCFYTITASGDLQEWQALSGEFILAEECGDLGRALDLLAEQWLAATAAPTRTI